MNALLPVNAVPAFTVSDVEKVASAIAKGGLFGSKDPYAVLTLCLLAQAEGQHPAVVFRDYHIISGKPAKKAEAMLRDFINAGGKIEWHALTDEIADATFSHPSGGTARISWDHKRAIQAQLAGNAMYKKYPRQMLRSRTISEGVRTIYPGATSGLYVPEEVSSFAPTEETHNGGTEEAPPPNALEHVPDEPAAREKLEGKHASKSTLKAALKDCHQRIADASSTREIDAIVKEFAGDIEQGVRYLPKWIAGDPDLGSIGLEKTVEQRRDLVALVESLQTTETRMARDHWMEANEPLLDELDDARRSQFDKYYEQHDAGLLLMDQSGS